LIREKEKQKNQNDEKRVSLVKSGERGEKISRQSWGEEGEGGICIGEEKLSTESGGWEEKKRLKNQ